MAKIIILEGPDGAGKSVLARKLEARGARYVHHGPPKKGEDLFETYLAALEQAVKASRDEPRVTAFDRLHLGELVYGNLVRGRSQLGTMGVDLLERYAHARGAVVVLCLPPWRVCEAVWRTRQEQAGEYVKDVQTMHQVYRAYADLLFRDRRPYVWYDWTRHGAAGFADALLACDPVMLPPGVVGGTHPRFLFVGERANTGANGGHDLPFMSLKGCSAWLYNVLREAGFEERDVAFANARDCRGKPHPDPMLPRANGLERMVGPNTIALGQVADDWLTGHGIGHHTVEHPQYHKRFRAGAREAYVARLREIRRGAA